MHLLVFNGHFGGFCRDQLDQTRAFQTERHFLDNDITVLFLCRCYFNHYFLHQIKKYSRQLKYSKRHIFQRLNTMQLFCIKIIVISQEKLPKSQDFGAFSRFLSIFGISGKAIDPNRDPNRFIRCAREIFDTKSAPVTEIVTSANVSKVHSSRSETSHFKALARRRTISVCALFRSLLFRS